MRPTSTLLSRATLLTLALLCPATSLAADAGPDAARAVIRDAGVDASGAAASVPSSPHATGDNPHGPHGPSALDAMGGSQLQDVVEEDGRLAPTTIDIEIRDNTDKPRAKVPVTLGIIQNSVAKGESRKQLTAVTDESGHVRWDKLDGGSQMAYRVSVNENGAQFAARPFQLDAEKGMRVVLHTYPVTSDLAAAMVVMQSIVYVELKDDRVQVQQAFNIFNFGKNAWVPRDLVLPLPDEFSALSAVQQMSDQSVETEKDRGARISGTFTPGQHAVEFRWQLPYSEDPKVDFSIGMPPNLAAARVMVVSAGEMKVAVDGFPPVRPTRDGQGNAIVETERDMRREEAPLRSIRVILSDIPTPGMAREVGTGIAAIAIAVGLSFAFRKQRPETAERKKERKAERDRLLAELEELERAHRAGDVGPRTYEAARRELIDALARTLAAESTTAAAPPAAPAAT